MSAYFARLKLNVRISAGVGELQEMPESPDDALDAQLYILLPRRNAEVTV
jgi:hypothetical protein